MKNQIDNFVLLPNGNTLYLLPISEDRIKRSMIMVEERWKREGKLLPKPTYETVPGERVEWDKQSVLKDGTKEEIEDWENWEQNQNELTVAKEQETMYTILVDGTLCLVTKKGQEIDLAVDDITGEWENVPQGWLKRLSSIPDNGYDLKFEFLNYQVNDAAIKREIVSTCVTLSIQGAMTKEGLQTMRELFRSEMEKQARSVSKRLRDVIEGDRTKATDRDGGEGALDGVPKVA